MALYTEEGQMIVQYALSVPMQTSAKALTQSLNGPDRVRIEGRTWRSGEVVHVLVFGTSAPNELKKRYSRLFDRRVGEFRRMNKSP